MDVSTIDRKWLLDLKDAIKDSKYAPTAWLDWKKCGKCKHLTSKKVVEYRKKEEQIPKNESDLKMIREIYDFFDE